MEKKMVKTMLAVITAFSMMSSVTVMAKEENETVTQEDFLKDLKNSIRYIFIYRLKFQTKYLYPNNFTLNAFELKFTVYFIYI